MIKIDEVEYKVTWKEKLKCGFEILNGGNTGRLQNTGDMYLDPIGTFFNYEGTIMQNKDCSAEEWDNFLLVLANPLSEHMVTVPFNQGYMTWKFYISSGARDCIKIVTGQEIRWANTLDVKFTAMESQWPAGGELQGYTEGVT